MSEYEDKMNQLAAENQRLQQELSNLKRELDN